MGKIMTIKSTNGARISDTRDFVLTTENPDRIGDIVLVDGLNTKNFEANPVALYMHNHNEPIGVWTNLKRVHGALVGSLQLASKGTSKMVDFTTAMVEQGMLKAVSVSFIPIEKTKNAGRGFTIQKSELVEVSLVTVPMNPQALMIAKSLNMSHDEIEFVFNQQPVNRDPTEAIKRAKSLILASKRCINS